MLAHGEKKEEPSLDEGSGQRYNANHPWDEIPTEAYVFILFQMCVCGLIDPQHRSSIRVS
jgi:hypothetical protein